MTADIFISHARKDAGAAQTICDALEQRGFACWIAARDVDAGENFQVAIVRAIRAAEVLILIFSANANNSDEIKKEVVLAGQNRLVVIPVRIEDVEPDEGLAYELATRQWIDYFEDRKAALQRLIRRLETISGVTRIDPAASTLSNPAPTETLRGASPPFRASDDSAQPGSRARISRGLATWPSRESILWRKGFAGIIGVGVIGAAIWGVAVGVDSAITPHPSPTSDRPQASGAAQHLNSAPLTKAPVAPEIDLSPTPGAPTFSNQSANMANASARTTAVAPAGTFPGAKDVEKFIGKDVYSPEGMKVGELNNFLVDPDGRVRAGIIEFGGFLGMGEHMVAIPCNALNMQSDRVTTIRSGDQIKSAPAWNKDHPYGEFAQLKPYR